MAVLGSIYASVYASRLAAALPGHLPKAVVSASHASLGAALGAAQHLSASGDLGLAREIQRAARHASVRGLSVGCVVASGVAVAGAIMAAVLLPAFPGLAPRTGEPAADSPGGRAPTVRANVAGASEEG